MKPHAAAKAQDKLLFYLKTKGPQTAGQLAKRLAVTPMAVRQHLAALLEDGLVGYEDQRGKVGRPARFWHISDCGQERFPDSHAELALGILQSVRESLGEAALSKMIEARCSQQIRAYRLRMTKAGKLLEKRVAALAALRREEGYMAEWRRAGNGDLLLIENHCPICAAAQGCQGLCEAELSLFEAVLGEGVRVERTEHIVQGDRRCVYRIAR